MSLRRDAEYYRVIAERHVSAAVDLEKHPESTSAQSSEPAIKHR